MTEASSPSNKINRHGNKARVRRICLETNGDEISTEILAIPNNISQIYPKSHMSPTRGNQEISKKYFEGEMASMYESEIFREKGESPKKMTSGAKIALKSLVKDCEAFKNDQSLMK